MTTITTEERARWKSRLNANAGLYDIHLKDMLRKALDALEVAEKVLKVAYTADARRLLELIGDAEARATSERQRACEVSGHLMQMSVDLNETVKTNHALKERVEKAEAERDVLGRKMASAYCCYPSPYERADPRCSWLAGGTGQCVACWFRWAAQEVERQAAENRKSTTPS